MLGRGHTARVAIHLFYWKERDSITIIKGGMVKLQALAVKWFFDTSAESCTNGCNGVKLTLYQVASLGLPTKPVAALAP